MDKLFNRLRYSTRKYEVWFAGMCVYTGTRLACYGYVVETSNTQHETDTFWDVIPERVTCEEVARAINRCLARFNKWSSIHDEACANAGTDEMQRAYLRLKGWQAALDVLSAINPVDGRKGDDNE